MTKSSVKKTLQKFKHSDLENLRKVSPNDIAEFLHNFTQVVYGQDKRTKMISLRIPENILEAFRFKAQRENLHYQSIIVDLMREWLKK